MQHLLQLALSTEGFFTLLTFLLTGLGLVLGSGAVRRRRVALAAYHAFNVVEDVAAECRASGKEFPFITKAAAGLKFANEWMRANGWRELKPGEEDRAQLAFKSLHGEQKAALPRGAAGLLVGILALSFSLQGCATGPRRAGLGEALVSAPEAQHLSLAAEPDDEPKASPLSVGPMLAVVVPFNGEPVRPAQFAVGTVRVNSSEKRAINVLAFGGFVSQSFKELDRGGIAGGLGASVELTPGDLLYSVDLGAGIIFGQGFGSAGVAGVTITAKL